MSANTPGRSERDMLNDLGRVTKEVAELASQPRRRARDRVRKQIEEHIELLRQAANQLDPVLRPLSLFDPGDPQTAARIIALAAVAQPRHPLKEVKPFYGAGVYALYYCGSFNPYIELTGKEQPIYIGKADPTERNASDPVSQGQGLYRRLTEHSKSIKAASTTLSINDFECRFLVVQSGFQQAAETHLINFFKPIWNNEYGICHGIGKHGDSSITRQNKRSPWDTLHPGRTWADKTTEDQKPESKIIQDIQTHLKNHPPESTVTDIIDSFANELRQVEPSEFRDASGESQEVDEKKADGFRNYDSTGEGLF